MLLPHSISCSVNVVEVVLTTASVELIVLIVTAHRCIESPAFERIAILLQHNLQD